MVIPIETLEAGTWNFVWRYNLTVPTHPIFLNVNAIITETPKM